MSDERFEELLTKKQNETISPEEETELNQFLEEMKEEFMTVAKQIEA